MNKITSITSLKEQLEKTYKELYNKDLKTVINEKNKRDNLISKQYI